MKTKLLILFIIIFSLGASCSNDDNDLQQCTCKKVHYTYGVKVGSIPPLWGYTKQFEEPATDKDCADDTGTYVQTGTNTYYRIECQ